jgi:hypothetical protein
MRCSPREVTAPTAVLIRPDGYVAWVGDLTDPGLLDALTTWFGPPTPAWCEGAHPLTNADVMIRGIRTLFMSRRDNLPSHKRAELRVIRRLARRWIKWISGR